MLQYLPLILILCSSGFCMGYFVKIAVPMKKPLQFALINLLLMLSAWLINNGFLGARLISLSVLIYPVSFTILLFYAEPGSRLRAILVLMSLIVIPMILCYLAAAIVLPVAAAMGIDPKEFIDLDGKYYLLLSLIINILNCFVEYGMAHLLKAAMDPAYESKNLLWFLTIPITQLVLLTLLVNLAIDPCEFQGVSYGIFAGLALSIASDIACIFGYRKYRKLQETNYLLKETEHQLELQAEHFRKLQQDVLLVNEIRHDLKNQLQAAYYLLDQGCTREVRQQLDQLNERLSRRVGSRYCENLMVDAVLTEKAEFCQKNHIPLQISALVPQRVSVENAYLCSAFSNLLDNSIHAIEKLPEKSGTIDLSSDIQGDYLVIRCSNPAQAPSREENTTLLREHGLGLQILSQIARRGGGKFYREYEGGVFKAVLILKK